MMAPDLLEGGQTTLYVGNLHPFVTESMLLEIFATLGQVAEVKVIKDKLTNLSAGYGFVKFIDHRCAELALQSIHGRVLYGQEVRVNWAFQKNQKEDTSTHFHIFVGDLSSEVNDRTLLEAFASTGCSDARVLWDHNTGRSRGYGFVSFRTREEADRAIQAYNGEFIGNRRVRCGWAQHKQDTAQAVEPGTVDKADPTNSNVYVGNVGPEVSDAQIRQHFSVYGSLVEVKVYRKGSYAFVRFERHEDAVRAIVGMTGQVIGDKAVKCSWGRHQNTLPAGSGALAASMMMGMQPGLLHSMLGGQGMMGPGMSPMMMAQAGGQLPSPQSMQGLQGLLLNQQQMLLQGQGQGLGLAPGHAAALEQQQAAQQQHQQQQQLSTAGQQGSLGANPSLFYGMYYR